MIKPSSGQKLVLSIDDIDPSLTPSLVAFWKCNEGSGNTIYDYSGNNYHMTYGDGKEPGFSQFPKVAVLPDVAVETCWNRKPGYVTPLQGFGFYIPTAGTLLNIGTNFCIWSAELWIVNTSGVNADMDYGWHWAGRRTATALPDNFPHPYGMNIGQVGDTHWMRMAWADAAPDGVDSVYATLAQESVNYSNMVTTDNLGDTQWSIAGAFIPGVEMRACASSNLNIQTINGSGTETFPASMGSQGGIFGIRGQSVHPYASSVRNIQVWSFASEPQYINAAMAYMAANHGKLPPWWIGR